MARIYSRKKGKHGSKKPIVKTIPKWITLKKEEVESLVETLAKQKLSSSQIGTVLRDRYGIPDVQLITGKKTMQTMREKNVSPEMPEDLMRLFGKAVKIRDHLPQHKKDKKALKGLEHLESKIRRLVKYYKREGKISVDFYYDPAKVKLIVQK